MYNKLTPQHYCEMIVNFINSKYKNRLFTGRKYRTFIKEDVYNHCLEKTEILDKNDDVKISALIDNTLSTLIELEYLSLCGINYCVEKPIAKGSNIPIFDEISKRKLKHPSEIIKKLNKMDLSLSDDPTVNFGKNKDGLCK